MRRLVVVALLALPLASATGASGGCCGPAIATDAQWLPDGHRIAYRLVGGFVGTSGPYVLRDLDDGSRRTLVPITGGAALSPDGARVAAIIPASFGEWSVAILSLDGTMLRPGLAPAAPGPPAWSPDGRTLVFTGKDGKLQFLDVASGALHSAGGVQSYDVPSWSPDSSAVAVSSSAGISVVSRDGSQTLLDAAPATHPAWSPAGDSISFDANDALWLIRPDGTGRRQLRVHAGGAVWSPDAKRLAAVLTDEDRSELAVVELDGSAYGLGALAVRATAWSSAGLIAFAVDTGHGTGIEVVKPDGSAHRGVEYGCAPDGPPRLIGCSYFGGRTVPLDHARGPLRIRLAKVFSRADIRLQLAVRDARGYRVRAAPFSVTIAPAGAASVSRYVERTLDSGTAQFSIRPRGRLPAQFRIKLGIVGRNGRTVARRTFGCQGLHLAARRGC